MRRAVWAALALPLVMAGSALAGPAQDAQLLAAAKAQDPETALYALQQGADAQAREGDGTTALHYAAHFGLAPLAAALLKAKADPNARNDYGATPLAEAAEIGDAPVIGLLLKAGARTESRSAEGQTALRDSVLAPAFSSWPITGASPISAASASGVAP